MEKVNLTEGESANIVNENIAQLKTIFPEAFSEDGVDFDVLRQLLGDAKVLNEGEEKFGLNWHGKKQARQIALTPSTGTLRPCPEESVDWDTTQNLFIEGDNLEVLKLLQKSYAGKVKMIYIDPPYNTGKEFIYPDNFQDNLDTYLRYTGQKGENGLKFSSNTESSGRYHTNWLNMMYPRLKLAKNLLTQDGIICVSIDDVEVGNLRVMLDEVFGAENRVAQFIWNSSTAGGIRPKHVVQNHEYALCYTLNIDALPMLYSPLSPEAVSEYKLEDNQGKYREKDFAWSTDSTNANQRYLIECPDGSFVQPPDGYLYRFIRPTFEKALANNEVVFKQSNTTPLVNEHGVQGKWNIYIKKYLGDAVGAPSSLIPKSIVGISNVGTNEVKELFENQTVFNNPKSTVYLSYLMTMGMGSDDIVLDFFAGSGSTAHTAMRMNTVDGGKRRFILVQLPESIELASISNKRGFRTIADIGKERIRRAAKHIRSENPMFAGDLGFKVFKLDSSNIRAWNPDVRNLKQTLLDHIEHLVPGRSEQDVLYELLLKRGVDLTTPIESRTIAGKTVYNIGYGVLFACLAPSIERNEVEALATGIIGWHGELQPSTDTHLFFRDSAFADDIAKTNLSVILEQHGMSHVRSL